MYTAQRGQAEGHPGLAVVETVCQDPPSAQRAQDGGGPERNRGL